ncbi:hypothetical protein ATCC90586_007377 [Pythium insidiosum]|nr:hypothetical protein ATCC90586_007377 [Pythium insidiosum]
MCQATKEPPQRVKWENVHERPEQKTLHAWVMRTGSLFVLYFLWVCGLGFYSTTWLLSFFYLAKAVVFGSAESIPTFIRVYLMVMALYESYHFVMFRGKEQSAWPSLRQWYRKTMATYPYFRQNMCIFEDQEEESFKDPLKPLAKADEKAMYGFHPHGVLSCGWSLNGAHSMRFAESGARWLVAENLFWFPLMRDILHWLEFGTVAKKTFLKFMREGRNICLIPGGFEEATLFEYGKHRVYVKKRLGFIKLALQHGYKVRPVYTFGEELTFRTFSYFLKQRLLLNQYKIPGVAFTGRLLCFFLPFPDVDLVTVVGKAIELPKIEHPTREEVAKYHKLYVDALVDIFERNKAKYARNPEAVLEVY